MQKHSTATLYLTAIAASLLTIGLTSFITKKSSPANEGTAQVETASIVSTTSDKDRYAALRKAYPEYMREVEAAKRDAEAQLNKFKKQYPEATWTSGTRDIVSDIERVYLPQAEERTFQRNGGLKTYRNVIAKVELAERYMFRDTEGYAKIAPRYIARDGVSPADAKKWCGV